MSFSTLQAMNNQAMNTQALAHANPMPNLMRIAIGNADTLGLNAEQISGLKAWVQTNKPKMKEMIHKVMMEEAMLLEDALTTDNDSVKKAETMLETRKQIIATKAQCRMTLRKILTEKQYAQVIAIYRSTH